MKHEQFVSGLTSLSFDAYNLEAIVLILQHRKVEQPLDHSFVNNALQVQIEDLGKHFVAKSRTCARMGEEGSQSPLKHSGRTWRTV